MCKCYSYLDCRSAYVQLSVITTITCPDADVAADISQHGLQSRFENIGIESHQFVVVQVDDLKVVACIKIGCDIYWLFSCV